MDDLLREFLSETSESLDAVDNQLVRFEQEPNNARMRAGVHSLDGQLMVVLDVDGVLELGTMTTALAA